MPSAPLSMRLTGYGLFGLLVQLPFTGTHTSLWMLALCGAGGLVLDGADELLRLPTPLRALGLLLCIYALGNGAGWAVEQLGGECPWTVTAFTRSAASSACTRHRSGNRRCRSLGPSR